MFVSSSEANVYSCTECHRNNRLDISSLERCHFTLSFYLLRAQVLCFVLVLVFFFSCMRVFFRPAT